MVFCLYWFFFVLTESNLQLDIARLNWDIMFIVNNTCFCFKFVMLGLGEKKTTYLCMLIASSEDPPKWNENHTICDNIRIISHSYLSWCSTYSVVVFSIMTFTAITYNSIFCSFWCVNLWQMCLVVSTRAMLYL